MRIPHRPYAYRVRLHIRSKRDAGRPCSHRLKQQDCELSSSGQMKDGLDQSETDLIAFVELDRNTGFDPFTIDESAVHGTDLLAQVEFLSPAENLRVPPTDGALSIRWGQVDIGIDAGHRISPADGGLAAGGEIELNARAFLDQPLWAFGGLSAVLGRHLRRLAFRRAQHLPQHLVGIPQTSRKLAHPLGQGR